MRNKSDAIGSRTFNGFYKGRCGSKIMLTWIFGKKCVTGYNLLIYGLKQANRKSTLKISREFGMIMKRNLHMRLSNLKYWQTFFLESHILNKIRIDESEIYHYGQL